MPQGSAATFRAQRPNPPFLTRDLLATGPPERLVVRQGPAGQGGIQVAGLTHWDVPNLETLHQVRLPSSGPLSASTWGRDTPPHTHTPDTHIISPDAESGKEQPSYGSYCHEPAQLTLPRPSYVDFALSVSTSRPG